MPDDTAPLPDWITQRVDVADDGCWLWCGSRFANGYPRCYDRRTARLRGAHRVTLEIATATPVPEGFVVDHLCGRILCVNPSHLEAVTRAENARRGHADRGRRLSVREQQMRARGIDFTPRSLPAPRYVKAPPPPRPSRPAVQPRTQLNLRLPDSLVEQVREEALAAGMPVRTYVEKILTAHLRGT